MKNILLVLGGLLISSMAHSQNVGIGETSPANKLSVKGSMSVGTAYSTTAAPTDGAIIKGNVAIGTASPTLGYLLTLAPNSTVGNGLSIVPSGASGDGITITAGSANVNGMTSTNSTTSTSSSVYTIGGVLSATNIVSGYMGYRTGSGLSYGVYGINGTNGAYATNASTWAAFLQGRTVISSESSPSSALGTDLEVRNTTTGGAAPATVSLRQSTAVGTSGNVLANVNFGDNNQLTPQAQIQVIREATSSNSSDLPTAIAFSTITDGASALTERMRISNTGNVGVGTTGSYPLDVNGVINSATGYKIAGGAPSTSTYLKGNGTNFVAGSILAADIPALNYVPSGTGAAGQVAYFTAAGVINGSANNTFAVNPSGATALFVTNTSATTSSAGILGTETGNGNVSGVQGSTTSTTTAGTGVGGFANGTTGATNAVYGQSFSSAGVAVYGVCSSTSTSAVNFAVYGQNTTTASGATHVGTYGSASGGTNNAAIYCGGGEVVIANSQTVSTSALLTRNFPGSIFTQVGSLVATGGRFWWSSGGYNWYVNSSGSADYSEYFYTADQSLAVGEIVSLDADHANSVRRARPSDAGKTVGVVSIAGSHNNDNEKGNRGDDPNYINVGMLGQLPVLVSTENGNINPGDALTLSSRYRGRAVKAVGPCRIVGYATTHFPYVAGEKDYETDLLGGTAMRLSADHVMCYLNVGWYEPVITAAGDGEELPVAETAHAMMTRLNTTLVSPQKAEQDALTARIKAQADLREHNLPAQAQSAALVKK